VYEVTESQIISTCIQDKNHFNNESKHQSWHANLNTVNKRFHLFFKLFIFINFCFFLFYVILNRWRHSRNWVTSLHMTLLKKLLILMAIIFHLPIIVSKFFELYFSHNFINNNLFAHMSNKIIIKNIFN